MRHVRAHLGAVALPLLLAYAGPGLAETPVADAAMRRDAVEVRRLLQGGADVNAAQADGATALHWAAYHGDASLASLLLEAGADVASANRDGSTPLWLAASNGDAPMIEALLEGGANANEPLPLGRRPLMLAARAGSVDAVQALLEGGEVPLHELHDMLVVLPHVDGRPDDHGVPVRGHTRTEALDVQAVGGVTPVAQDLGDHLGDLAGLPLGGSVQDEDSGHRPPTRVGDVERAPPAEAWPTPCLKTGTTAAAEDEAKVPESVDCRHSMRATSRSLGRRRLLACAPFAL